MKKKNITLVIAGLFSAFCLTSCGETSTPTTVNTSEDTSIKLENVTIKYWNGFTGKDGDQMKKIVDAFNKEYSGQIKVEMDTVNWDNLFLKLIQNKGRAKFSPHVVAMGANRLSSMVDKGIISKMNDYADYVTINKEETLSEAWNIGQFDNDRYSLPLDMHPTAMFYNKDLISEEEIPTTWEEFATVIKEKTKDGIYGWAIPSMYSITKDIFVSMLMQNGEDILDAEGNPTFNSSKAVELLDMMKTWKFTDKVSPESVGSAGDLSLFNAGKSVFYFDGPWEINTLKDTSPIDFGVAPMPGSVGETGCSYSGSHQLTMVDCTTQDAATRKACYTFISYVNSNPLEWAKGGQVVANKTTHETAEYKALEELQPFTQEAYKAKLGNMHFKYYYEIYNYMGSAVADALGDRSTTAKQALDNRTVLYQRWLADQD